MSDGTHPALTPSDAALRARITELSVHLPCGVLRGPVQRPNPYHPELPVRWQSCRCEDNPQRWPSCDVSREKDLCIICLRATAGGDSRWSWRACEDCRAINDALGIRSGTRPFALGRHSLMNGVGVRGGQSVQITEEQITRLLAFARGDSRLTEWQAAEFARLAGVFEPTTDVALSEWQHRWPPGPQASAEAFERLLGGQPAP